MKLAFHLLSLICGHFSYTLAVSQPVYANTQYVSAQQAVPHQAYQPQYVTAQTQPYEKARPTYESSAGLQKYSTQIKQPLQLVQVNQRQGQHQGPPLYLQQIQAAQAAQTVQHHQQPQEQILVRKAQPQPQHAARPQYAGQQVRYVPRPAAQGYRPQQQQQEQEQQANPEDYDPNPSYQFGFDVNDDIYTNYQNRKEQREGNKITGSYSVVDSDGFVRTVTYTADPKEGFKAEVVRQPTDIVVKVPKPDPQFIRQQPQQYVQAVPQKNQQTQNVIYQYE